MSFDALAWAARASGLRPAEKLVLLGLAECADRHTYEAHPSIAALVEFGGLNRKTVIAALDTLGTKGLIAETGECVGKTKQVKVYRLSLETVPKTERSPKRNSSVFSVKQSQKRDTDTVREPVLEEEDKSSPSSERASPEEIIEAWNETAKRYSLPAVRRLTPARRQSLAKRAKENTLDEWRDAVGAIDRSPFLQGNGPSGWKPNFDWFLKPANLTKLIEGAYDRG